MNNFTAPLLVADNIAARGTVENGAWLKSNGADLWSLCLEFVVPMLCNMGVHVNRQQATDRSLDLDTPTVRSGVQSADRL